MKKRWLKYLPPRVTHRAGAVLTITFRIANPTINSMVTGLITEMGR